ncbi:MAG: hypothetical protein AAGD07_24250, partial [Planctomycetota bacterium]
MAAPVSAQSPRDVFGGILEDLLRSQMKLRNPDPVHAEPSSPPQRVPGRPVDPVRSGTDIEAQSRQVSDQFASFARESERLGSLLRRDSGRVPGVGENLDEVLKLQARTQLLSAQRSPRVRSQWEREIRDLDRDWRLTSYRLASLPGLSSGCRQSIQRLSEITYRCCQLYDLEPGCARRPIPHRATRCRHEAPHLRL